MKSMARVITGLILIGLGLFPLSPGAAELTEVRDHFQASQWLRLAKGFWETGDYPQLGHFCHLILTYYPDTNYAVEAKKLLKETANPAKNRLREKRRNNPALPGLFVR